MYIDKASNSIVEYWLDEIINTQSTAGSHFNRFGSLKRNSNANSSTAQTPPSLEQQKEEIDDPYHGRGSSWEGYLYSDDDPYCEEPNVIPGEIVGEFSDIIENVRPHSPYQEPELPYGIIPGTESLNSQDFDGMPLQENYDEESVIHQNIAENQQEQQEENENGRHDDPTKYISVFPAILAKAADMSRLNPLYGETTIPIHQILQIREYTTTRIAQHRGSPDFNFSLEEEKWLVELSLWEALFPESRSRWEFPGKTPCNPVRDEKELKRLERGKQEEVEIEGWDGKSCRVCKCYGRGNEECPLMKERRCADHGWFWMRLGYENFGGKLSCAECQRQEEEWAELDRLEEEGLKAEEAAEENFQLHTPEECNLVTEECESTRY